MPLKQQLAPLPLTCVQLQDSFWAPRMRANRSATLPAEYAQLESTGRLAALELAWQPGAGNPPHIFWDSDIAKWIEAAAYALAAQFDAQLDAQLDAVIARVARAQQPDGYLNTHFIVTERAGLQRRWTNLRDSHELYCAGHLIEAAVAHFEATGKRTLLDVMCRYADCIDCSFGRGAQQQRGYPGHEEVELALVKLHRATGEARYLGLARYFIDERGQQPHYFDGEARARGEDPAQFRFTNYEYNQSHLPVRQQTVVTGHAVRAMYLYSAMADVANADGDAGLLAASQRLWHSVVDERMYITGGIGPAASNEGFTHAYDLPDETAYAETCAAIGMVFWNQRLLQFAGDGRYADVLERALYNGVLSGVSLDGLRFFYENPLASRGAHHRAEWFDCACCPPNIARLMAGVGGYFYSTAARSVWVHLYAAGTAAAQVNGATVRIAQHTHYPWDGRVELTIEPERPLRFALHLRVPGWCRRFTLAVNGKHVAVRARKGYVAVRRVWRTGDKLLLQLAMPVRLTRANPHVRQMAGRVAVERGPLVYCLEGTDHKHAELDEIALPLRARWTVVQRPQLLGGVAVLRTRGLAAKPWRGGLYAEAQTTADQPVNITAVPYCVWDNRAPGEMRVWLRTAAK